MSEHTKNANGRENHPGRGGKRLASGRQSAPQHQPEERRVPVIFVGTPAAHRRNPGLDAYLAVSDREDLQDRITQFASHVGVQYVLDALFGCMFSRAYEKNLAFLRASLPHTRLPAPEG